MNGNHSGGYRRRDDKARSLITGGIVIVSIAIAVFGFLILAEIFGWFEKAPVDPLGDTLPPAVKFNTTETEVFKGDVHKGDLILINDTHMYVFPDTAPALVPVTTGRTEHGKSASGNTIYSFYTQNGIEKCAKLESETQKALLQWADGFYNATSNSDLFIFDEDGYRTKAEQEQKHGAKPTQYSVAGASEHHTGKIIDLYVYTGTVRGNIDDPAFAATFKWVYDNAYKYGFVLRYPDTKQDITGVDYEPYHFRQVGYAHAYYMSKNNLCLEEYLELLKSCTAEEPLEFKGDDNNKYMVYYQAASADATTKLTVPAELPYTVSGDNIGGFIVTVNAGK